MKPTKGMGRMKDVERDVLMKPWWRRGWVILSLWLPLIAMVVGIGWLVWWTKKEVRLWEDTKAKWEAKGVSLELSDYFPPAGEKGDAVMDDEWFVRVAGSGFYDGSRATHDPDLQNELYGEVMGPPGQGPDWMVLDWYWGDPTQGLVLGVPFDPDSGEKTNEEAARVILDSIAGQEEENERMNQLMELPMFVRGGNGLNLDTFADRFFNVRELVGYFGKVARLHATVGDGSQSLEALRRARKALRWQEQPKSTLDWMLLRSSSGRFVLAAWTSVVHGCFSQAQLEEIAGLVEKEIEWKGSVSEMVRGELAYALAWMRSYESHPESVGYPPEDWKDSVELWTLRTAVSQPGFMARNKRVMTELKLVPLEKWESASPPLSILELGGMLEAEHAARYSGRGTVPVEYFAQESGYGGLVRQFDVRIDQATWDMLKVTVAVARYRLKHDGDPEVMEDLVPEFLSAVPEDPFVHGKLQLMRDEEGRLMVYSAGEDEVDDGGNLEEDLCWYMEKLGVATEEEW